MKKLLAILIIIFAASLAWAGEADRTFPVSKCPKTTMQTDCLKCHIEGNFKVKETLPDAQLVYPFVGMRVIIEENLRAGYYLLTGINSKEVKQFFDYLDRHDIKKAIIEIHSAGGGLFDAQRIVGLIRGWQTNGGHVITKIYGAAFSAGFYVFTAGDVRLVDEYADLMWHELQSFEGFGFIISTPSDKEETARVLRHLQNIRNSYLATRGKLSKEELDAKVSKREFWMSGVEALKFGFATGFINKKK